MSIQLKECENLLIENDVFVFGIGRLGKDFLETFQECEKIKGIFDNNFTEEKCTIFNKSSKENKIFPIYPIEKLKELDNKNTIFIITTAFFLTIKKQLNDMGFEKVFFAYKFKDFLIENFWYKYQIHPAISKKKLSEIEKVKKFLSDDESKKIIDKIVEYRENEVFDYTLIKSESDQYFEKEIIKENKDEIIIDAGAFTGDTLEKFISYMPNYKKIYSFEPDDKNYEILQKAGKRYVNVIARKAAIGEKNGKVRFSSLGTDGSLIDAKAENFVEIESIDSLNEHVSFIKMDIEGAEMNALKGAKKTIEKYHPKLAICIYHHEDDIWRIPLLVKKWVSEYNIYIRHYDVKWTETVMYAICDD